MEFWLDTAKAEEVKQHSSCGVLYGVTTNPILLKETKDVEKTLKELLESFNEGPLAVQVGGATAAEMIAQGEALFDFSDRIIVKVPVTKEGLKAIYQLSSNQIPVMATAVFSPHQALLAAEAGAEYVALYFGRFIRSGGDGEALLKSCRAIFDKYHYATRLLVASLQELKDIDKCLELGLDAMTLKNDLFSRLLDDHPLTLEALQEFDPFFKAQDASLFKPRTNLA